MMAFEKVCLEEKPNWVVVVGDVNATLACSITAKKLNIKVCHIEAGLRSGDMAMAEEINRLVTDRLSDLLLVPDKLSAKNLRKEGTPEHKIQFVGNIMIDTLEANRDKAAKLEITNIIQANLIGEAGAQACLPLWGEFKGTSFAVLTMHRPSNVDEKSILEPILNFLTNEVAADMPLIWPIHPRTKKNAAKLRILGKSSVLQKPNSTAPRGLSRDAASEHGCPHYAHRQRRTTGRVLRIGNTLPHPTLEYRTPGNPA